MPVKAVVCTDETVIISGGGIATSRGTRVDFEFQHGFM